jgi:GntR family transcriptional regulator
MKIDVDLTDHVPIYIQLMNQVKHMIATGELQPGDQLPTVRQLAADLRINFNTVARAYRLLDEESIISTQHGRGTFILRKVQAAAPEGPAAVVDPLAQPGRDPRIWASGCPRHL